ENTMRLWRRTAGGARLTEVPMRRWRAVLAVGSIVALAACLEPPVSETLDLRILPGGASIVSIGVALRDPSDFADAPRVQQRLESESRALEAGTDRWSARLRATQPSREREVRDRDRGRLARVVRHAQLDTPAELRAFLHDTGVGVAYDEGEGWAELTILP